MDWLLGGPAAPFLGEEDDWGATLAPPPFPANFPGAVFNLPSPTPSTDLPEYDFSSGFGTEADTYLDLPTPTPALSDEDPEHFMPPGYGPVPGLESPSQQDASAAAPFNFDLNIKVEPEDEETGAPSAAAPLAFDLNVKVEPEDEESFTAAPASPPPQAPQVAGPPTPPPEARRLLRRFAAAMASSQPGFRAGTWNPDSIGLSNVVMPSTGLPDGSADEDKRGGSSSRRWW